MGVLGFHFRPSGWFDRLVGWMGKGKESERGGRRRRNYSNQRKCVVGRAWFIFYGGWEREDGVRDGVGVYLKKTRGSGSLA